MSCILHSSFCLYPLIFLHIPGSQSVTITKYLHEKFDCADHWFPKSLQQRSRVNEYLDWQHFNTRPRMTKVFLAEVSQTYQIACNFSFVKDCFVLHWFNFINNAHTAINSLNHVNYIHHRNCIIDWEGVLGYLMYVRVGLNCGGGHGQAVPPPPLQSTTEIKYKTR